MPDFDLWTEPIPAGLRVVECEANSGSISRIARTADMRIAWLEFVLMLELPNMTKTQFRMGGVKSTKDMRIRAILAAEDKKSAQNTFLNHLKSIKAVDAIYRLQRQCAADQVKLDIYLLAARRVALDRKNVITSLDELIFDPLQRPPHRALFNDRETNIHWQEAQRRINHDLFDGHGYVFGRFKPSIWKCGDTTKKRYREEILGRA